jgi:hypothetical protein
MSEEKGFAPLLILVLLILLIASFTVGYYLSNSLNKPTKSNDSIAPNSVPPSATPSAAFLNESDKNWSQLTYREYGLSFDIPAGWSVEEDIAYNIDGLPNISLRDQNADPFIGGSLQIIIRDNPNHLTAREYVEMIHIPEIKKTIQENNFEEANIMIFDFENSAISPFKVRQGDAVKLDGSYHVGAASNYPVYFVSSDKKIVEIIGKPYNPNEGNESGDKVETEGEEIISTIRLE